MKFKADLYPPCMVGGTHEHTAFKILTAAGEWVGNGVNVVTPDGKRFIRIFNHDTILEPQMEEYFSSRKGVDEVTFNNPRVTIMGEGGSNEDRI